MADGDALADLKTQEIVFLGNMYVQPKEMLRYGAFLENNKILTTPLARGIWKKMYKYFNKNGSLPDADVAHMVFSEQEWESLSLGIEVAADPDSQRLFILDTFSDTMQMIVYRQAVADMEDVFEEGATDVTRAGKLERVRNIERALATKLSVVRRTSGMVVGSISDTYSDWLEGTLPFQLPRVPIPLPGMEWVSGSPIGCVNVIIGSYGVGKTTTLCTMAAELCKSADTLYVTLETHSNAISFKVMSCQTHGVLQANHVFLTPNGMRKDDLEKIQKAVEADVMTQHQLYLLDMPPGEATAAQLENYILNLQRQHGITIPAVIVDYASLMRTNSGHGREDVGWGYTGTIITELSAVAKNLGLTIWTGAQAGGEGAHIITASMFDSFKPLRGGQLYGSKEVLHDASISYGLAMLRSNRYTHLACGVLSTIKSRYGEEFYDYICDMDYARSSLNVLGVLDSNDGDTIQMVSGHLKEIERQYEIDSALKHKEKQQVLRSHIYKPKPGGDVAASTRSSKTAGGAQVPKASPQKAKAPNPADSGDSMRSAYGG